MKGDTCDVQSAGFVVCSECPDSIAQLRGKPRKDSEPAFGCIHVRTMVWSNAMRNDSWLWLLLLLYRNGIDDSVIIRDVVGSRIDVTCE
jgi:hypothetical protein